MGENPATTSIDEGWILVHAHNVCIDGFTIISHPDNTWHGPVTAWGADNGTLCNNVLIGTGIYNGPVSDWPSVIIRGSGWIISQNTILERLDVPTEPLCGLWVYGPRNIVVGNTLGNETVPVDGLEVSGSGNIFYHNNFHLHYGYAPQHNTWDDGYPSGGNYWSGYADVDLHSGPYQNETGSDGIGDTPYVVYEDNQDNYSLVNPWTSENAIGKLIRDEENMNLQQGIDNSLDAKLTAVLNALEALNADKRHDAVNKLESFIAEVEAQREKKLTIEQADYLIATAQEIIGLIN